MSGAITAAGSAANTAALNANQAASLNIVDRGALETTGVMPFIASLLFLLLFSIYLELVVRGFLFMITNVWDQATGYKNANKKIRLWWLIYTLLIATFTSLLIHNLVFCVGFLSKVHQAATMDLITISADVIRETLCVFTISASILYPLAIIAFIVITIVHCIRLKKGDVWYVE